MIGKILFGKRTPRPSAQREHPSADIDWGAFLGVGGSIAGITVNENTVLTSATVYACVRVLSQALASLPLLVYRRLPDGGKARATTHPLYPLLHNAPNAEMSSYDFRQTLTAHVLIWGNAFAQIELNRAGLPIALWPLPPNQVRLRRLTPNGPLVYDYYQSGGTFQATLPADQVIHIRGLSNNGIIGYSPVRLAMRTFGLDMALEEFGSAFFSNGARPSLVVKHPGKLSMDAIKRIRQSFDDNWSGLDNAHRVQVLEEGMTAESLSMPLDEVEFLDTRKFERSVIAGWFGVPSHMIGDLDRATFSNVTEQQKSFYQDTLRPLCSNWEGALLLKLARNQDELVIEHLFNDLLLSNPTERAAYHQTMTSIGLQTINEGRAVENMNPVDGGDVHLVPMNLTTLDRIGKENDSSTPVAGSQDSARDALQPLIDDVKQRIATRIANDVRKGGAKALRTGGEAGLDTWLAAAYPKWEAARDEMLLSVHLAARKLGATVTFDVYWISQQSFAALDELLQGDRNGEVATGTRAPALAANLRAASHNGNGVTYA